MAMNLHTTLNTTPESTNPTYVNKTFYDRKLLEIAKTKCKHMQFGQKRGIPKNNGQTVEYRKWNVFEPLTAPLTEGVVPDGQSMTQSRVEATVAPYGAYVATSDMLSLTSYDPVADAATDLLSDQIMRTLDHVTRDEMCSGTLVQYANGKEGRNNLTAADILTTVEIRKAVRTLKKAKAMPFSRNGREHFVCICSPDATFDLQSDPLWQDVSKYSNAEQIYSGEIGRIFGVVFVESTEAKVFDDGSVPVHATLVFGQHAYGTIDIEGSGRPRTIIKPRGSGGTGDPLDQFSTVGVKVEAYTAKILQPLWILRIEHGVTA